MSSFSYNNLYRIFEKIDQNEDGLINAHELQWLLDTMKVSSNVDDLQYSTGKTNLSFTEFLEFYANITQEEKVVACDGESNSDLFKAFEMFDKNRDGFICNKELLEALSRLGLWDDKSNMDVESMIKAYDANSDGFLDFHEFKKMMA